MHVTGLISLISLSNVALCCFFYLIDIGTIGPSEERDISYSLPGIGPTNVMLSSILFIYFIVKR